MISAQLFKIEAAANGTEATVRVYDRIGEYIKGYDWYTGVIKGGVSFENFDSELSSAAEKYNNITIRVNTIGGDVATGTVMCNAVASLTAAGKNVTIINDGEALSMGGVFVAGGPKGKRAAAKNARFMLHSASALLMGTYNAAELRAQANASDVYDKSMAAHLSENLGLTVNEVTAKYFDGQDHWFTAEEALAAGLIDYITTDSAQTLPTKSEYKAVLDYVKTFQASENQEENFLKKTLKMVAEVFSLKPTNSPTPQKIEPMKFEKLEALLASATGDVIITASQKTDILAEVAAHKDAVAKADFDAKVQVAVDAALKPVTDAKAVADQALTALQAKYDKIPAGQHTIIKSAEGEVELKIEAAADDFETSADREVRAMKAQYK